MAIVIYTDGASKNNGAEGTGGFAAVLTCGEHVKTIAGNRAGVTNNRMELLAVFTAVHTISAPGQRIEIITDSQYVARGFSEWLPGWIARGWKTAKKKPVANADIWRALLALIEEGGHEVTITWTRGYSGDPMNERADHLASRAAELLQAGVASATGGYWVSYGDAEPFPADG